MNHDVRYWNLPNIEWKHIFIYSLHWEHNWSKLSTILGLDIIKWIR